MGTPSGRGTLGDFGQYSIEKKLATGGMAEVYLATRSGPHGFEKQVALKRILPQHSRDEEFRTLFIEEARMSAYLQHPNIVQVFDFGERERDLFLTMELVSGASVARVLSAIQSRKVNVPLDVVLHIGSQTAHALRYAHRLRDDKETALDIVHRDVSPANILLTVDGHVKLTDFGIATISERTRRTEQGQVRGKLGYMSPEQVLGKPLDGRSDVFTLATVLTELLIEQPLFAGEQELDVLVKIRDGEITPLLETQRRLPAEVRAMFEHALARRPRDRPHSGELAETIDEIIRRRGYGHGPERTARLLSQLELVQGASTYAPAGRATSVFRTDNLDRESAEALKDEDASAPVLYRIRKADGAELGPFSFPRLVEFFTSGEVSRGVRIRKASGEFVSPDQLPELSRFVTSPALQWDLAEIENSDANGKLASCVMFDLLYSLARDRETGVLHLWRGAKRKKIYLVDGVIEFVASNDRRELLGEHLIAHGHCLKMEVDMALAVLPRYGGHLGDALVGLGVLSSIDLFRAIRDQVHGRLLDIFSWRQGSWAYVRGVRSHEDTFSVGRTPFEVLRDAVNIMPTDELDFALADFRETPLRKSPQLSAGLAAFRLDPSWQRLVSSLQDGTTCSGVLARETAFGGLDVDDVYRAMFLAIRCGLVEFADR